jgi:hypothetical protein
MKKILLFIIFLVAACSLNAQQDNTPAAQLAHHIAEKMKDTLGLSNQQRARVFQINMDLFHQKDEARKKSTDRAVVGRDIQTIEKTRDSLYKLELTAEQYLLYLQKKRWLVNNN